ncbi:MAG: hypothetical protein OHK0022_16100 [Roseiflexaceae bacterium]
MANLLPTTRRNALWLTGAVVSVAAGLLLLAVLLPLAALAATLALALLIGLAALGQSRALRRRTIAARSRVAQAAIQPVAQRTVYAADGSTRQALLVPIPQTDDFELVLTVEGYALVDESGRVVYRLK